MGSELFGSILGRVYVTEYQLDQVLVAFWVSYQYYHPNPWHPPSASQLSVELGLSWLVPESGQ